METELNRARFHKVLALALAALSSFGSWGGDLAGSGPGAQFVASLSGSGGAGGNIPLSAGASITAAVGSASHIDLTAASAGQGFVSAKLVNAPAVNGASGVSIQVASVTLLDVGVTTLNTATLAAGVSLAAAAGTGAVDLHLATGAFMFPSGTVTWTGAAGKTATFTGPAGGGLLSVLTTGTTIGVVATSTIINGTVTFGTSPSIAGDVTGTLAASVVVQLTGSASSVSVVSGTGLTAVAGAGFFDFHLATGAFQAPTGNFSWAGAANKTLSLVATGAGATVAIDAGTSLTLGGTGATSVPIGNATNTATITQTVKTAGTWSVVVNATTVASLGAVAGDFVQLGASGAQSQIAHNGISYVAAAAAAENWTVAPQAATANASGSFVVNAAVPGSGTAEAGVIVQRAGAFTAQISTLVGNSAYSALYLTPGIVPSASNYVLANNGTLLIVNATTTFEVAISNTGKVQVTTAGIFPVTTNSISNGSAGNQWTTTWSQHYDTNAATLGLGDVSATGLLIGSSGNMASISIAGTAAMTAATASAGGGADVPAAVQEYMVVTFRGNVRKIPMYLT